MLLLLLLLFIGGGGAATSCVSCPYCGCGDGGGACSKGLLLLLLQVGCLLLLLVVIRSVASVLLLLLLRRRSRWTRVKLLLLRRRRRCGVKLLLLLRQRRRRRRKRTRRKRRHGSRDGRGRHDDRWPLHHRKRRGHPRSSHGCRDEGERRGWLRRSRRRRREFCRCCCWWRQRRRREFRRWCRRRRSLDAAVFLLRPLLRHRVAARCGLLVASAVGDRGLGLDRGQLGLEAEKLVVVVASHWFGRKNSRSCDLRAPPPPQKKTFFSFPSLLASQLSFVGSFPLFSHSHACTRSPPGLSQKQSAFRDEAGREAQGQKKNIIDVEK